MIQLGPVTNGLVEDVADFLERDLSLVGDTPRIATSIASLILVSMLQGNLVQREDVS